MEAKIKFNFNCITECVSKLIFLELIRVTNKETKQKIFRYEKISEPIQS